MFDEHILTHTKFWRQASCQAAENTNFQATLRLDQNKPDGVSFLFSHFLYFILSYTQLSFAMARHHYHLIG